MRRSTTQASTPASASSAASMSPVGPPPAISTACSVIAGHGQHVSVACSKPPPARYVAHGGLGSGAHFPTGVQDFGLAAPKSLLHQCGSPATGCGGTSHGSQEAL